MLCLIENMTSHPNSALFFFEKEGICLLFVPYVTSFFNAAKTNIFLNFDFRNFERTLPRVVFCEDFECGLGIKNGLRRQKL